MGWNPTTKHAADHEFGRRHYRLVKFWRTWLVLAVAAVAAVVWLVVTAPASPESATGPQPVAATRAPGPANPVADSPAGAGEGGNAFPYVVGGMAATVAIVAAVLLARRRRDTVLADTIVATAYLDDDETDGEYEPTDPARPDLRVVRDPSDVA